MGYSAVHFKSNVMGPSMFVGGASKRDGLCLLKITQLAEALNSTGRREGEKYASLGIVPEMELFYTCQYLTRHNLNIDGGWVPMEC